MSSVVKRSDSEEETYISHSVSSGATIYTVSTVDLLNTTVCSASTGASVPTVRTTEFDSPNTASLRSSSVSTIKSDDKTRRARGEPVIAKT